MTRIAKIVDLDNEDTNHAGKPPELSTAQAGKLQLQLTVRNPLNQHRGDGSRSSEFQFPQFFSPGDAAVDCGIRNFPRKMAEIPNGTASPPGRNETIADFSRSCLEGNLFPEGIWNGRNPLDSVIALSMFQVVVSFAVSWGFYFLLRPLGMPKFVSSCLGGIVLGPSVLGQIPGFMEVFHAHKEILMFDTVASFSATYYVFLLAVKIDPGRLFQTAKHVWSIGLSTFLVPFFIVSCLYFLVREFLPGMNGGILPLMTFATMSASCFPDTVNALNELNLLNSELGQIATSSAAINDAIVWLLSIVSHPLHSLYSMQSLVSFGVFGIVLCCVMRPTLLWVIRKTPEGKQVSEGVIVALLLGCAISGLITDMLGMSFFPGVLFMGLVIPGGPPLGSALIERSEFMVHGFFAHFLFIGIGRITDVTHIWDWKAFAAMLLIIVSTTFGKIIAVCLGSLHLKMSSSNVFLLGLMLNMKGPIELIFLTKELFEKHMDPQLYSMFIIFSILITAVAAHLLPTLYRPHVRLDVSPTFNLSLWCLSLTRGEFRVLCCIHNEDDVQGMISLLEATNPTEENRMCAYVTHVSELVGRVTPHLAPYRHHKKFRHNSTDRVLRAFTNYSKGSSKSVTVHPFTLIAPYRSMHESIFRQARDNSIPLIILPFHENQALGTKSSIRSFNSMMLAYAPCTVGILVQRKNFSHRVSSSVSLSHFSYNVALIFLGGDDDREALTLADRMSGHPYVIMTVLRIIYTEACQERNQAESKLDDYLITAFKEKHSGNACVVCNEVVAETTVEVINAVNCLTDPYDLVIVGKKPDAGPRFEEELGNWTVCPELGIIGDVIVSSDFAGAAVSVLSLQHHTTGDEVEDGGISSYFQTVSSAV